MTNLSYKKALYKKSSKKKITSLKATMLMLAIVYLIGIFSFGEVFRDDIPDSIETNTIIYDQDIPPYSGEPYVVVNKNIPFLIEEDILETAFEEYSELDALGRCGVALANISRELMPTEKRGDISAIKPTGWKQKKYEGIVNSDPPYLYNRCHLIAHSLTGEDANEKNLITGTRYMNAVGMLPFEEEVVGYLRANDNHVLYRATPIFEGDNLLASGVLMEAYSVEDEGRGICFCVYVYNVQPGIEIDYRTGESYIAK